MLGSIWEQHSQQEQGELEKEQQAWLQYLFERGVGLGARACMSQWRCAFAEGVCLGLQPVATAVTALFLGSGACQGDHGHL